MGFCNRYLEKSYCNLKSRGSKAISRMKRLPLDRYELIRILLDFADEGFVTDLHGIMTSITLPHHHRIMLLRTQLVLQGKYPPRVHEQSHRSIIKFVNIIMQSKHAMKKR